MLQYGVREILILDVKLVKYVRVNDNPPVNILLLVKNYIGDTYNE